MDVRYLLLAAAVATAMLGCVSARAVNISNTWMLPEEGFPVFYRYFRDRISWYEADAVCQFHHANLVTVDSASEFDAVRAYLKELDIASNVWIGLSKSTEKPHFTWTDFRPLSNDGHWQEAIPVGSGPLCAATDPAADFRWHALQCGGPEVASFICELPVPSWATGSKGCLLTELPSLTVLYVPEQSAIELTSDCGLDGTKRIACKGNADRDEMMRQLSCGIINEDYGEEKVTKGPTSTTSSFSSGSASPNSKTTKPWIWTSNTIDTGDYGAPTRHRRETENTLEPVSSTWGTTDLTMREKVTSSGPTEPSVFPQRVKSVTEALSDVTLDLSVTQKPGKSANTQEASSQADEQEATVVSTQEVKTEEDSEYPGVINQGQLFSIIENGTMFDIIELSENGTEETAKDSQAQKVTESSTQGNLYTTVIYHKEPPEDLKQSHQEAQKPKQEVTPTFNIHEPKPSFGEKTVKQKTINDLSTDDKILTKEVEMIPIVSDSSIKLNRTYRKKLPLIESNLTKEDVASDASNSLSDSFKNHKIVEIKLHNNKNATHTKLFITTKIPDKSKKNVKVAKTTKPENETKIAAQKQSLEKFDDSIIETKPKEAEIDPKLDVLNNSTNRVNNESEIISNVEHLEKKEYLPKQLLEDTEDRLLEMVVEEPQETITTITSPTGEPLEQIPQQQPRPNRQRLLTKPQRRSFYPYFFSRVLG